MQYAQLITFKKEIVLTAVYAEHPQCRARRFSEGEQVIGLVFRPCSDGNTIAVLTIVCSRHENDKPPPFTYNGDFILANVQHDAVEIENTDDDHPAAMEGHSSSEREAAYLRSE